MSMPHPHNHEEWSSRRAKYNDDWKEKQKANKKPKDEADASDPPDKESGENLYLAKSSKYALSIQVMFSNQ